MREGPRYSEAEARVAIGASRSFAEALRRLDMCATGNNWRTLRYAVEMWRIPVAHFDPHAASRDALLRNQRTATPLAEVLVEGSSFSRVQLKQRLYAEGLKQPVCEMCGQGELWRGRRLSLSRRLSLILDHGNGVSDDHRVQASGLQATALLTQLRRAVDGQPDRPGGSAAGGAAAV
jgi:hypothetical protein